MFRFSKKSIANMKGVHPDLIKVAERAIELTKYDFGISSTSVRTLEQQKDLMKRGASKTMNSRHIPGNNKSDMSCAIDIQVYDETAGITWSIGYFRKVNQAFVTAAIELGVQIELGILWKTFIDGPHIQLSKKDYP